VPTASRDLPKATVPSVIRVARQQGLAVGDEETRAGMCCHGAPIFDAGGHQAVAAVALSMMKTNSPPPGAERIELAARTVHQLARLMSHRLGMLPGGR